MKRSQEKKYLYLHPFLTGLVFIQKKPQAQQTQKKSSSLATLFFSAHPQVLSIPPASFFFLLKKLFWLNQIWAWALFPLRFSNAHPHYLLLTPPSDFIFFYSNFCHYYYLFMLYFAMFIFPYNVKKQKYVCYFYLIISSMSKNHVLLFYFILSLI